MVGSLVAPVWPPTGGGSAMGGADEQKAFLTQVRKACAIGASWKISAIRRYGVVRIDSAASPADWAKDPAGNTKKIADTFQKAADIAESTGERLAIEGEICWGGMHSVKRKVELLEMVNRPKTVGFQADMAHTLLFTMGYNAPEDRILPEGFDWSDRDALDAGAEDDDRSAARVDCSTSTSRRTTAPSRARARTTRPAATACPSTPTASSTSSSTPASGCATTRQPGGAAPPHLLGRLHVPERGDDAAANLERRARRDEGRARRARLGLVCRSMEVRSNCVILLTVFSGD